jgi:UDP-sulfoquinovose synthase
MKVLILGADGYLGWPTAMHFAAAGDEVHAVDNFAKRKWVLNQGAKPLQPVPTMQQRIQLWRSITGQQIHFQQGSLCDAGFVQHLLKEIQPDAIIHYAEQPSAPYSMLSNATALETQLNNVGGTLNLLWAMRDHCPDAHLVKLGSMGEYGTPNIDIEEGYLDIEHKGRKETILYPKRPGSMYHLSKVHDSNNIAFACRAWGITSTDLNQGVVYGFETEQTKIHADLRTSFHHDEIFGTVLNRFLYQAATSHPLTVYGEGGQTRGFLNIVDTLQCVELATRKPPGSGEFRIMNQFTEQFSVLQLAEKVQAAAWEIGIAADIRHNPNKRIEAEKHYYNAAHSHLIGLGLQPHLLTPEVLERMLVRVFDSAPRV